MQARRSLPVWIALGSLVIAMTALPVTQAATVRSGAPPSSGGVGNATWSLTCSTTKGLPFFGEAGGWTWIENGTLAPGSGGTVYCGASGVVQPPSNATGILVGASADPPCQSGSSSCSGYVVDLTQTSIDLSKSFNVKSSATGSGDYLSFKGSSAFTSFQTTGRMVVQYSP